MPRSTRDSTCNSASLGSVASTSVRAKRCRHSGRGHDLLRHGQLTSAWSTYFGMVNQIYDRTMYPTSCAAGLLPLALAALSLCVKRQPPYEAIRVSKM